MDGRSGSENDGNPATFNEYGYTMTLEPGQSVTVQFSPLAGGAQVNLLVNGVSVLTNPSGSHTISYTSAAAVVVTVFVHEASFGIASSCGAPAMAPLTNAELAAATRDALTQSLAPARPASNPDGLPGSGDEDPCEQLRQRLRALVAVRGELEREILANRNVRDLLGPPLSPSIADPNRELRDFADARASALRDPFLANAGQIARARAALDACLKDNPGLSGDDETGELGEGDELLFFPRPDSHVPWPIVHAYAGNSLDTGSDRFFEIGGMPANFWTRVKGSILDGAFGRTGFAGSLQAGLTVGVTDEVDLGVYGYLLTGRITSTPLSGELTTLAAALGAYIKARLDNGLTLGLSASQEIGSNAITLSGATGSFLSSLTTLDASVGFEPIQIDGFILSPSLALGWKHAVNDGYSDSNGLAVPQTTTTTLAASASLGIAYPMAIDHPSIATVTPSATVSGSFFILPGPSLALTPGTLSPSRFTLDASIGVALGLVSGGTLDLAVSAGGIGGPSMGYGVRAGLRVPIN